ncbi:MAG: glycosyltransferase family 39 protein [Candidatus Krumholzibacteria bacterium]|nr:glycosyltransferase family 39 protein [Candidatus Krumholzibacteria bacterium]MDH4336802.1 glycosyltransferase family 39 protein [Candidatus Krumholzibacteria bacterium]MDH5269431.1 glycosyltransferase family 39 protein [Candidatus Krumholzibacteria bacterium]
MPTEPTPRKRTTRIKEVAFFGLLTALGLAFFSLARNNSFWHGDDWNYLIQALEVETDWRQLFSSRLHETIQPLPNLIFFLEFEAFGLNAASYYLFNVLVHSVNAFLVYFLVRTLLQDRAIAVLSGLLFEFAVGNYGKSVMTVSGSSDLVITALTLLTMIFYVKNELEENGAIWERNFNLCLLFFTLCLLSKTSMFSLLGLMVAFNLFFRETTGRKIFDRNVVLFTGFALAVLVVKLAIQREVPGASDIEVTWWSIPRNFAGYLVRMVFPIHSSTLVANAGAPVRFIYDFATAIRVVILLCIISYSFFGFIFGNRVIRFFIAWTYIVVTPFCFFRFPADWLDIRFLYLVSVGFDLILASGTVLAARLLYQHRWRRMLPYLIPVFFVMLSYFVLVQLDENYEYKAKAPGLNKVKASFYEMYSRRTATHETLPGPGNRN